MTTTGLQAVTATAIQTNGTHATTNSTVGFTGPVEAQTATAMSTGTGAVTVNGNLLGASSFSAGSGALDVTGT